MLENTHFPRFIMIMGLSLLGPSVSCWADDSRDGRAWSPKLSAKSEEMATILKDYQTSTKAFKWHMSFLGKNRSTKKWTVTFSSAVRTDYEPNNLVRCTYYQPMRRAAKVPAVVILHHLGGSTEAEEIMGAHLAQHGVAALTLTFPYYKERRPKNFRLLSSKAGPEQFQSFIKQAVSDVRGCADVLRSLPEVDEKRVSVLGVSLGAIVGASSAGIDGRFHRVVLVLGGGRLGDILLHDSREVRGIREQLKKKKIDGPALHKMLANVDPVTFAHRVSSDRVLMFNAKRDEIIPRKSTEALHKALGAPSIKWYPSGHYTAALHILNIMRRSLRHLRD